MAVKKWTLVDESNNTYVDQLVVRETDVGRSAEKFSVVVRTLRCGLSQGVMAIRVDNGIFAYEVLSTRGMGVWKAWLGAEEIGWKSPVRGPVHPAFVAMAEPSGLGWLDGFDELLVRCGLESNGAPDFDADGRLKYPLHGRIANKPAHKVELMIDETTGEIILTGEVEESRFHFNKLRMKSVFATRIAEPGFRLRDEVQNFSQSPAEMQLLYHVNVGRPLLDAGSRVVAPAKTVVPRNARAAEGIAGWDSFEAEQPGFPEQVYFFEMLNGSDDRTQVLLKNAHATRGVSLVYSTRQLPCFSLWKNTTSADDGYVTGLEPATNFPNPRTYEGEQGRVRKLAPGESAVFDLALLAHGSAAEVEAAEAGIERLRGTTKPTIHKQPKPGWCAP